MNNKPVVKFKTYKQATRVGGKIYGVANLADPVVANVTMQEVIDYAKLHNYSADTLEALLSQVISGVADLVARDGRPRNLSDLLKFEPTIKGTFANLEAGITDQKVVIRPRLLKEIRVNIANDAYSWRNQNDTLSPRIISVAPDSDRFSEVTLASVRAGIAAATGFGWTLAGSRLAPSGWDETTCRVQVLFHNAQAATDARDGFFHLENYGVWGYLEHREADVATDNAIDIGFYTMKSDGETGIEKQAWYYDVDTGEETAYDGELLPLAGDTIVFRFTRTVGSGDTFTIDKTYVLA